MSINEKLEELSKTVKRFEKLQNHSLNFKNILTGKFKADEDLNDSEAQTRFSLKACFQAGAVCATCNYFDIANQKQARIYFFESHYENPELIETIVSGFLGVSKIDDMKEDEAKIIREIAHKAYEMGREAMANILNGSEEYNDEYAWVRFLEYQEELDNKLKKKWFFF